MTETLREPPPPASKLRTDADVSHYARSLDCIHCGLCLEACPTYKVTGRENASPRGRVYLIRAVSEGRLAPADDYAEALDQCLVCRSCETVCPSGVRFGELMEYARDTQKQRTPPRGILGAVERFAFRSFLPRAGRVRFFAFSMRVYQRSGLQFLVRKSRLLSWLAPRLARGESMLPVIPAGRLRKPLAERHPARGEKRGAVAFLEGCVVPPLLPEMNHATVRVLTEQGYEVLVPRGQTCCGALHFHFGHGGGGAGLAQQNIAAFAALDVDAIITNSAGCGAALKEYPHHVEGAEAEGFATKVQDVSEFLASIERRPFAASVPLRVAYDDPCHLVHAQGVSQPPRDLLGEVEGLTLVPLRDASSCCGAAGIYNLVQPELSGEILARKVEAIREAKVDVVATGNPGCMLQIQRGLQEAGLDVRVCHPLELMADGGDTVT